MLTPGLCCHFQFFPTFDYCVSLDVTGCFFCGRGASGGRAAAFPALDLTLDEVAGSGPFVPELPVLLRVVTMSVEEVAKNGAFRGAA